MSTPQTYTSYTMRRSDFPNAYPGEVVSFVNGDNVVIARIVSVDNFCVTAQPHDSLTLEAALRLAALAKEKNSAG